MVPVGCQLEIWRNPGRAFRRLPSPHRAHSAVTLASGPPVLRPSLTLSFALRSPSFRDRAGAEVCGAHVTDRGSSAPGAPTTWSLAVRDWFAGLLLGSRRGWPVVFRPQMVPRWSGVPPDSQLSTCEVGASVSPGGGVHIHPCDAGDFTTEPLARKVVPR